MRALNTLDLKAIPKLSESLGLEDMFGKGYLDGCIGYAHRRSDQGMVGFYRKSI